MKAFLFLLLALLVALLASCVSPQPPIEKTECATNADCVPASCCHAVKCVPKAEAPNCQGTSCTEECAPGSIDCGGRCACVANTCTSFSSPKEEGPVLPGETDTKESCYKKGGAWQHEFSGWFCNFPAGDADKKCTSNEQCEGACLVQSAGETEGRCSEFKKVFGCVIWLNQGKAEGICID